MQLEKTWGRLIHPKRQKICKTLTSQSKIGTYRKIVFT